MEMNNTFSEEQDSYFDENSKQQRPQFEGLMFAVMSGSAAIVMGMLLFRRPLLISFLQQWRFLAINLLFLTIISLTSSKNKNNQNKSKNRITAKSCCSGEDDEHSKMAVEEAVNGDGYAEMSKEELNRRSEDFIARFRMQLVSDQAKAKPNRLGFVNKRS